MFIDWFTVAAQAVNFLVLAWLLKRFLYRPVLHAIEEREQIIARQLQDAASKQEAALKERSEFEQKNEKFDRRRNELLQQAAAEAEVEWHRLINEARADTDALRERMHVALQNEQETVAAESARRAQREVFELARKSLRDLADADLEVQMTRVFVRRLHELGDADRAALKGCLEHAHQPLVVRSGFELNSEQRATVERAVQECLGASGPVEFETSSALISGVELVLNGHKLAWNVGDYLAAVEASANEPLEANHANAG